MPRKDGLTLLRETKGAGADVEFIVITGYGDEDAVVTALRQGAINFLRKPVDIEQMLLAIQKALDYQTVRRSLAYRNRDVQLMQELVVRLTRELELVVETPHTLSQEALRFLHQLVDSLPLGLVVVDSNRQILYANRHVTERLGESPQELAAEWLRRIGLASLTDDRLLAAYREAIAARPGSIEPLVLAEWSFLVMTPLKLVRPNGAERCVALAIRGERQASASGKEEGPSSAG